MMTRVDKGLTFIIRTVLAVSIMIPLVFISCKKDEPQPVPVIKKLVGSASLWGKTELVYSATLSNVVGAKLVVNKDGLLIFSQEISDVFPSGVDYSISFKYVKGDPIFKNITKGKYEFILTSDDFASDNLENKSSVEIPNYKPTVNLLTLDLKQLNFMEWLDATLPIDTCLYKVFSDDNPEDNPISVTGVKSVDGKTTPTIKTTSSGYDLNVKTISGSFGEYQLELELGTPVGGIEKYILSGTIGKDTRMVINPYIYTDNPNAVYNSLTTRTDRDNYLLAALLQNPGNTIPYTHAYYDCNFYQLQLIVDSKKIKANQLRTPANDYGRYWLYNNSFATSVDSIYKNGGTLANAGTIEAQILAVGLLDKSHYPTTFGHAMNAVLTGRDLSTGSLLTKWENWNFIEPQADAINVQIGTYLLRSDCDEVQIGYPYIVEDKINGNYWESVTLVKFRIENGVPYLTYENKDPKYNILKQ